MIESETPVVFVHGLWIHASAWTPWLETFRSEGFEPIAPGWPGDDATVAGTRANPDRLAGTGIDDIVAHFGRIIAAMHQPPVVIGHSVGGLVTQRLNLEHRLRAAVAIDPAPIKGIRRVPPAQLRSSFPVLRNPANANRAVALTAEQFRYAFGNRLPAEESAALHDAYAIPGSGRPIFEVATANLRRRAATSVDTRTADRAPLLIVSADDDHTVPLTVSRATHRRYRHSPVAADLIVIHGRGHSLVFDHGWKDVAEQVIDWLRLRIPEGATGVAA